MERALCGLVRATGTWTEVVTTSDPLTNGYSVTQCFACEEEFKESVFY